MPGDEEDRVVVWRVGEALLAAWLDDTVEIAVVDEQGMALSRGGALEPRTPPGLEPPASPRRAVVVRTGAGPVAMAADEVEGVREVRDSDVAALPPWLGRLGDRHVSGLVRLGDGRISALLALDRLGRG